VKLEYREYQFGFSYQEHRAESDCLARIHLIVSTLPRSAEKFYGKGHRRKRGHSGAWGARGQILRRLEERLTVEPRDELT
jgi:hypothetical protein